MSAAGSSRVLRRKCFMAQSHFDIRLLLCYQILQSHGKFGI